MYFKVLLFSNSLTVESLFRGKKAFHAIDDAIDETLFL